MEAASRSRERSCKVKKYAVIEAKLGRFVIRKFFLKEKSFPAGSFDIPAGFPVLPTFSSPARPALSRISRVFFILAPDKRSTGVRCAIYADKMQVEKCRVLPRRLNAREIKKFSAIIRVSKKLSLKSLIVIATI